MEDATREAQAIRAERSKLAGIDYVRFVMKQTGLTASGLAERAGLSPTTLTRALNSKQHKFAFTVTTLDRIRAATEYDYAPFFTWDTEKSSERLGEHLANPDLAEQSWSPTAWEGATGYIEKAIPVVGEVAAGVWREVPFETFPLYRLSLALVTSRSQTRNAVIGLVVRGESLNRIAKDGDVLIVENSRETGEQPRSGDLVVAERRRDDGGIVEVTAKRFVNGQLLPESDDPRYQQPLAIGEHPGETVEVIGVVLFIVRRP